MNRRRFLQSSVLAAAFAPTALATTTPERGTAGFNVGAGKDRTGEDLLIMGGRFDVKVSTRDTGGDLLIYDTVRQSKGGPAFHRHHLQDEWFYVLRGDFIMRIGEETMRLGPGDSAFGPRKVPHAFALVSEGEGQMLILFQPAGSMEEFFHAIASNFGKDIPAQSQREAMRKLWADHGMEIVGPPLEY